LNGGARGGGGRERRASRPVLAGGASLDDEQRRADVGAELVAEDGHDADAASEGLERARLLGRRRTVERDGADARVLEGRHGGVEREIFGSAGCREGEHGPGG
jgi:hypothetical protein